MFKAFSWKDLVCHAAAIAAIMLCCLATVRAEETTQADAGVVAAMQREIRDLKEQLRALKEQVDALTRAGTGAATPGPSAAPQEQVAPQAPLAPEPQQPLTQPPRAASTGNAFNPAISAVFQAIGNASIDHDIDDEGLSLSEAEIGLQAVVDPYARVDLFLAFGTDGEAEVEEGYGTFLTLPGGLQAKAGRFKSNFGKWNQLHNHAFPTVDRPDALTSFFGEESLTGDGASLSWLLPGTGSTFVESVTEITSTSNDVMFNARRSDPMLLEHLSSVFTLSPSATIGVGATGATGKAGPTEELVDAIDDAGLSATLTPSDDLPSNVFGVDLTYKWKPLQSGLYRSFLWQTEAVHSVRDVEELDPSGVLLEGTVRSFGGYSYAEYQFAKRWRAGLRYDYTEFPDDDSAHQRGGSAVLRVQPTEFQEFRFQFKHTGRNEEAAARFDDIDSDNEFFIEWIPSIGPHPAHAY